MSCSLQVYGIYRNGNMQQEKLDLCSVYVSVSQIFRGQLLF